MKLGLIPWLSPAETSSLLVCLQVVLKIPLPYFATSLSLSPAASILAVGFNGGYAEDHSWAHVPFSNMG